MELEFNELYIKFDLEGTDITEDEKDTLISMLFGSEGTDTFSIKDKPRIRQTVNDTIDMLNKSGDISNQVAENITYSIRGGECKCI